jgi:predicted  nucleic acid-binding Zn-ribbon protein
MPTENDKTNAPAVTEAEKALDAKLAETKAAAKDEAKELRAENAQLKKDLEIANKRIAAIEKKLKEAGAAPSGDYVVLRGKTHLIERTVEARFATDEARKGYIDLDAELIVLKR